MAEEKTCFIIMPISTPEAFLPNYRDGVDHFAHILDCLFIPSVEAAGYRAIPPKAQGADLIHAEIIRNLEQSDLVLCDMSCLNPNVFFEFGIRTSLNRPVCVVRDEHTRRVPFDTGILNHQEYRSTLEPWELAEEVKRLTEHITAAEERGKGENMLWKYFGLRSEARPYEAESGTDTKLEYLAMQLESLSRQVGSVLEHSSSVDLDKTQRQEDLFDQVFLLVDDWLPESARIERFSHASDRGFEVVYSGHVSPDEMRAIRGKAQLLHGVSVLFRNLSDPQQDLQLKP